MDAKDFEKAQVEVALLCIADNTSSPQHLGLAQVTAHPPAYDAFGSS